MPTKVITAATTEPVSLAEAKAFLRVDASDEDTLIESLISAAREYAEHYTAQSFAAVVYELGLDAFPADSIALPNPPVSEVASIKYTDTAGAEQTLDTDTYVLADYGMTPAVYPLDSWPATGAYPNAVRVRYTATAATPAVVKAAILELVAHFYESRENASGVPATIARLLDVAKVYQ